MRRLTIAAAACLAAAACQGSQEGNEATAPSNAAAPSVAGGQKGQAAAGKSILDTLGGSQDHATLHNAVNAAGLTETLSGAQPYTLFAPTEAAFQKLPAGTMNGLLTPESKGHLTALLTSLIVPGTVTVQDITRAVERGKGKAQLATVGGVNLSFSREGEAILVTDAKGVEARLVGSERTASNGVVHSLDGVPMPQ
jgi:uncharacterized surface protein with fasciclin (FAS1) repeats